MAGRPRDKDRREQLGEPGQAVTFAGTVTQVLGMVVGLVSCIGAIREAMRHRAASAQRSRP
jgi:hypothetical protein